MYRGVFVIHTKYEIEAASGRLCRYQSMQEKLPMASFVVRKDEMWAMTDYEEKGRKR